MARDARIVISATLLCVDGLLFALTVSHVLGPWRFVLGVVFALTTPGWSLVGLLHLRSSALEMGLSIASSLALIMICAQVMMTMRLWHPVALEEVMCVACVPSLILQSKGFQRVANRRR
jgi:uncharacterized membrane protein